MFGTNPIVGKAFFAEAPAETLMVTSMFYTLQGEGPYSGRPCVFIRLTKCNLACTFCDTLFEQGQVMTFKQIFSKVYDIVTDYWNARGTPVPLWALPKKEAEDTKLGPYGFGLVVTGGEPTLQANLVDFLFKALDVFEWTQIESNGIITLDLPGMTTVVVSPKCAEKEGKPTKYLKPHYDMLRRADALKFVMSSDLESPYSKVPLWAHQWQQYQTEIKSGKSLFVSPMNIYKSVPQKMKLMLGKTDKTIEERSTVDEVVSFWENGVLDMEANRKNHEYAARYAMDNGFRFQVQTHLLASLA